MSTRTVFSASLFLGVCLAACGQSKVEQCNAFIDKANHSQTVLSSLKLESEDPKVLDGEAAKIDAEAAAVGGVEVKDEKLVQFRNEYASNLKKLAANVRDLSKLQASAKDPNATDIEAKAKAIEADAQKIEKDEEKLVGDINQYCTGSR